MGRMFRFDSIWEYDRSTCGNRNDPPAASDF